jgi:adenosylcobinamide-GDP ribazoletransferase
MAFGKKIPGIGSIFIENFSYLKFCVALVISILIGLVLFFASVKSLVVLTGLIVGCIITGVAHKNFGGVNGDVMGASNEISRCITLVVLCML